jgi:hypothetical protein
VYQEADDAGHGDTLAQADLENALAYTRPSTASVEAWSSLAVSMCNDYRLLPEDWRQRAEKEELPEPPAWAQATTRNARDF